MFDRRNRILLIICIVCLVGLVTAMTMRTLSLSSTLTINAVPSDSKVTINNKQGRDGKNRVAPGEQVVTVSRPGFASITQTVTLRKGETKILDFVLVSNSKETENWYFTNEKDGKKAEGISDRQVDTLTQESLANAPLIKLLPFVGGGLEFRVDYGNIPGEKASQPVVYITAPGDEGHQAGVAWIKSLSYDPGEYNIKFVTGTVKPLGE